MLSTSADNENTLLYHMNIVVVGVTFYLKLKIRETSIEISISLQKVCSYQILKKYIYLNNFQTRWIFSLKVMRTTIF